MQGQIPAAAGKRRLKLAVDSTETPNLLHLFSHRAYLSACPSPDLTPRASHAGAGGVRNPAISDSMSANIFLDTATSAIWKVWLAAQVAVRKFERYIARDRHLPI